MANKRKQTSRLLQELSIGKNEEGKKKQHINFLQSPTYFLVLKEHKPDLYRDHNQIPCQQKQRQL